jgi:hypothetical protein
MKRLVSLLLLCALVFSTVAPAVHANTQPAPAPAASAETSKVAEISTTLAAITGIAISPLFGTGAYGAYRYISSKDKSPEALPWFANPLFFVPALLIAGLCAAKDSFGAVFPPGWKKPLDVMETLENKLSGLVAAGAVIPLTMSSLSKLLVTSAGAVEPGIPVGFAMIPVGAMDFSWLLSVVTVPAGVIIFAVVWMASHAINVLILLSPWGAIDAALKSARLAVLGLLTVTTQMDPKNGAVLSLVIIVAAYLVSGWAFRLTTFGTIFCWDFFTRRRRRFTPDTTENLLFSGNALTEDVPIRTYGRLARVSEGKYAFRYRPWLLLPERKLELAAEDVRIQRGLIFVDVSAREKVLFTLPPRYCGHEEELARIYRIDQIEDVGLRKAWGWIADTCGMKRKPALAA